MHNTFFSLLYNQPRGFIWRSSCHEETKVSLKYEMLNTKIERTTMDPIMDMPRGITGEVYNIMW
jgi:hypothetical protein